MTNEAELQARLESRWAMLPLLAGWPMELVEHFCGQIVGNIEAILIGKILHLR